MKQIFKLSLLATAILAGYSATPPVNAGELDPELEAQLAALPPQQPVAVIVTLGASPNLNAVRDRDRKIRLGKIEQVLRLHADAVQPPVLKILRTLSASAIKPLWINNSIAATLPARAVRLIARAPAVARVSLDATLAAPGPNGVSSAPPEWNLAAVHAPDLWNLGFSGQGVIVANLDTGVDAQHPDLAPRYRGGSNSWFDPHGQHTTPTDFAGTSSGHGTRGMGLMVAGDAGGTSIGVAPGARWIAAKVFSDAGTALESDFHLSFQWVLDPDGNLLTADAADVVNGSFQTAAGGNCDTRFQTDIQALKTAGVAVVFAAGNSGPTASSGSSPANNPGSFSAGAVDEFLQVAPFSARGPSTCGGTLFPNLVAPGDGVNTTDLSSGGFPLYTWVSGTSFSAPHVAGSMALLLEAIPDLSVSALETALTDTAVDLGAAGPDNDSGHGLLNVAAAYQALANAVQNPVAIADSYTVNEDATLTVAAPGTLGNDSDPQHDPLIATLNGDVSHGTLNINPDGSFTFTPTADYNGTDSFTYKASDGSHTSGMATVTITVNPVNDPPTAHSDTASLNQGSVANIAVLANDVDPDNLTLTAALDSQPAHGTAVVNSDSTIHYIHDGSAAASDSFSYHANDGQLNSATVTVGLTINPVVTPVGSSDSFATNEDSALNVAAPGVLSNDNPASGLTAQLVTAPSHAASFALNANGSFSFAPSANYAGPDSFVYRAVNGTAQSGDITVSLTVNPVNDAPIANDDGPYAMVAGQTVAGNVLTNDSDLEGGTLTAVLVSAPSAGTLVLNPDGSFTYNSSGAAAGSYSFGYRADDGGLANPQSNVATVNLTVTAPVNTAPVATTDTYLYRAGTTRMVNPAGVLANDTDAEANPLTAQLVAGSLSGGGTLSFNGNGSFSYLRTSAANASFRYRANDGLLLSSPTTGTTVNLRSDSAPTTVADNCSYDRSAATVSNPERCAVTGARTVAMNLAANDTDGNATTNIPTDNVGKTVIPGSMLVTGTTTGVYVAANAACGQGALGSATSPRATVLNNCNGTVTVSMTPTNTANIVYSYKISDDLGAQSSARQVTLSSVQ